MANILQKLMGLFSESPKEVPEQRTRRPLASTMTGGVIFSVGYNGEKNLGEIGPIKKYWLDHEALRLRSWQSYLESEITQTVLRKFVLWIVGQGLKAESEPSKDVLKSENINLDIQAFSKMVEARFSIFSKSKSSDYSGMQNLNLLASTAFLNAIIGGDVLVVLRYQNNSVNVQLIDGTHVQSPNFGNDTMPTMLPNGNRIQNGIELAPNNEHVAFHVRKRNSLETERIEAINPITGLKTAYLVYGLKYRLDNHRGLPLIAPVLESLSKMERYKEATLGSAEERQKIVYAVEHAIGSTGESPMKYQMAAALDVDASIGQLPVTEQGEQLSNKVAASTNKQAFNMPIGSKLTSLESKNELYFKDFYSVHIDLICAALTIPPNVAMSKYDSNFSASRAALKEWEHTINVTRYPFANSFYQPIYDFWLETEILKNKIQAPGYLAAKNKKNNVVLDAYRGVRWIGPNVPHIDPLKEVNAERAKLGAAGAAIPLTTAEAATEALNGGYSSSNMEQFANELAESIKLGIVVKAAPTQQTEKEE
jgi:capsid protein